jgi:2-oxoisovalerate dehydrogenase E1 component
MICGVSAQPGQSTPHDVLDASVRTALATMSGTLPAGVPAPTTQLLSAFDAMCGSRLLDIQARRMREGGQGYYTIGSSGHESNAYVALALRGSDPALLHYRSGGFFLARALQAGHSLTEALRAVMLGMVAATADRASGGRHKVFGDANLSIIPQTSTIASHLPRAVGVAFALDRANRIGVTARWPRDSVTVCSFGDASLNHSTAVGALNTAGYCAHQGLPLPLLFVCEDNGIGISVRSPHGWVEQAARRPGIEYFAAPGDDPVAARAAVARAVEFARSRRKPAMLHLRTVRYLGHAGTDVEMAYRSPEEIGSDLARDPLVALARLLPANYALSRYDVIAELVEWLAHDVSGAQQLQSAAEVIAPLAPRDPAAVESAAAGFVADAAGRAEAFEERPPDGRPATLAMCINAALVDAMAARRDVCVFGEDVGRKGGVYGLTRGLQAKFGAARSFDTLLDEQSILGLGLGLGISGLLPVPEIQYLAYLHNAEDQLRGEAASLRFFSNGEYTNPMVVRIAGLGYQKGFGGHFHNDSAVGVLRDIPGLVVAVPSRPEDAGPMLRSCLGAAAAHGQVSVFLEPIALYHERDLYTPGDQGWLGGYDPTAVVPIGSARVHGDGSDLCIVSFGNGLRMSLRAARELAAKGIGSRVLDLRWLNPLPVEDLLAAARATGRVLVADETRHSGGVGEGVLAALVENGFDGPMARVASADSYVPLGPAAALVMLAEPAIVAAAERLVAG